MIQYYLVVVLMEVLSMYLLEVREVLHDNRCYSHLPSGTASVTCQAPFKLMPQC